MALLGTQYDGDDGNDRYCAVLEYSTPNFTSTFYKHHQSFRVKDYNVEISGNHSTFSAIFFGNMLPRNPC